MYQNLAEEIYNKFCETHDKNDPYFAEDLFDKIKQMRTNSTIGHEGDADISYCITECLKSVDETLVGEIEQLLSKQFLNKLSRPSKDAEAREALCQLVFHYGFEHVQNVITMIENYTNSLPENGVSAVDEKVMKILPTLKQIENSDKEGYIEILTTLKNSEIKTMELCDKVETSLRQAFVNDINKGLQATETEFYETVSRVKKLEGQKFDLIIHTATDPQMMMENRDERGFSLSLIDDKNIMCYHPSDIKFAFLGGLDADELLYAKVNDGSTDYNAEGMFSSFGVPDWVSAENFKTNTRSNANSKMNYSELSLKSGANMQPCAIVCFDGVMERELEFANKYKLGIILIDTSKYPDMVKPEIIRSGKGAEFVELSQCNKIDGKEI